MTISLLLISFTNYGFAQIQMQQTHIENPLVVLDTNLGKITIEFFYDDAPNHVQNFINCLNQDFMME